MSAHHDAALAHAIDRAHAALHHATTSANKRFASRAVADLRSARNAVMAAQMIAERMERERDDVPSVAFPAVSR